MASQKYFEQKGFTLVEVLVTLAIFTVLVFGVSIMVTDIFTNSNQQLLSLGNIDQARGALSTFTNEIRDAENGNDGSFAINQASDSEIVFFSNFKTSGLIVNKIHYKILNNILYKSVVAPTGTPLAYSTPESLNPVASGVFSGSFNYYDGNYNGTDGTYGGSTNPIPQPVNLNKIRYVKINLTVLNQIKPNDTSYFSITAGATVRGLKDNLGN